MSIDRRDFIAAAAITPVANLVTGTPSSAVTVAATEAAMPASSPASLADLASSPLVDRARAAQVLTDAGFAAIVCSRPSNVYHLTNYWAVLARMGVLDSVYAVLPRDPKLPIALVLAEFSYYYTAADHPLPPGVVVYLYTGMPSGGAKGSGREYQPTSWFPIAGDAPITDRERLRRERTQSIGRAFGSRSAALLQALKDLDIPLTAASPTRVGFDDVAAQTLLNQVRQGFTANAEDSLRRIRLVKTPAELALMRAASQNNIEAALATAQMARELGTMQAFRRRFLAEAAARGNAPVFMVIDSVSSDAYDAPIVSGSTFMIDCVTQFRGYHGDFGRTVVVGELNAPMRRATQAMAAGWGEIRSRLKPGMTFREIAALGRETLRKHGYDHAIPFSPHSVGLWHTDQPRAALDGTPVDVTLEAGMVISVDCPLMDTGRGGTGHLEDLTLITATGSEIIHRQVDGVLVV